MVQIIPNWHKIKNNYNIQNFRILNVINLLISINKLYINIMNLITIIYYFLINY